MSQKLLVNGFEWVKELLKLNKDFIKNHDENSNKRYILEIDVEYPKSSFNLRKDLQLFLFFFFETLFLNGNK